MNERGRSTLVPFAARALFPVAVVIALAILVRGYRDAGDGFSAGLLVSLAAIAQYVCLPRDEARRLVGADWTWRAALVGLGVMLTTVLLPVVAGRPPVWHVPRPGAHVTELGAIELHSALLFDLGIALLVYGAMVSVIDELVPPEEGR